MKAVDVRRTVLSVKEWSNYYGDDARLEKPLNFTVPCPLTIPKLSVGAAPHGWSSRTTGEISEGQISSTLAAPPSTKI
jgi:hypothetical protein